VRLVFHRLIPGIGRTRRLARELNALSTLPRRHFWSWPDVGQTIIALFRYGSPPNLEDPVRIDLGCNFVVNGHVVLFRHVEGGASAPAADAPLARLWDLLTLRGAEGVTHRGESVSALSVRVHMLSTWELTSALNRRFTRRCPSR
jgi:hypothetical protein